MKKMIFILPLFGFAQVDEDLIEEIEIITVSDSQVQKNNDTTTQSVDDRIYQNHEIENTATFPGGEEKMSLFISENYVLPPIGDGKKIEGMIHVAFVIEKNGLVSNVKILRGLTKEADEETIRVIESMPNWKPAKIKDQPVKVQMYIPLVFQ
jgi:TonB family protein